jgi:hypothetical protein
LRRELGSADETCSAVSRLGPARNGTRRAAPCAANRSNLAASSSRKSSANGTPETRVSTSTVTLSTIPTCAVGNTYTPREQANGVGAGGVVTPFSARPSTSPSRFALPQGSPITRARGNHPECFEIACEPIRERGRVRLPSPPASPRAHRRVRVPGKDACASANRGRRISRELASPPCRPSRAQARACAWRARTCLGRPADRKRLELVHPLHQPLPSRAQARAFARRAGVCFFRPSATARKRREQNRPPPRPSVYAHASVRARECVCFGVGAGDLGLLGARAAPGHLRAALDSSRFASRCSCSFVRSRAGGSGQWRWQRIGSRHCGL